MKRIFVFGDSNSWGYTDEDDGHRFEERWPISLKTFLSEMDLDVEIIEDCLPGRTTNIDDAQDGSHLNGAKVLMSSLLANSPIDLVIIMLGTNDLKIRFQRTPDAIAEGIKELINTVKNTTPREKNIRPTNIIERSGLVSVFGRLSDKISKKTIIESITVAAKEILSPEFQGINILMIINVAVAKVGTTILIS